MFLRAHSWLQRCGACSKHTLTLENMNPCVKVMEYAVRGPIATRAGELEKELKSGGKKPFSQVITANMGDAHAMEQKPITFIRQVLALLACPTLMDKGFPEDVVQKARLILECCRGGSIGSYSESQGIGLIRKHAAEFIERRDGFPSSADDIMLGGGASDVIRSTLKLFVQQNVPSKEQSGVLIPIPQYPLYSASIAEFGMHQIGYYLDERRGWALEVNELERALQESRKYCEPRALVVINPGNPTGQLLSKENIKEIIQFACANKLFLLADEVYQDNVYGKDNRFFSVKQVLMEMGGSYRDMELASYFSASKGYMGECGIRGGYAEFVNLHPEVKTMLYKLISAKLCSTTLGQGALDCVVSPPTQGDPSYELFSKEKTAILDSLQRRAAMVVDTFSSIPGITCNPVQGAMYAFPQIRIPPKALEAAKKKGQPGDTFYAFELLEETGICVVSGSGFGQYPGTYHFRTTILPQEAQLAHMLQALKEFHSKFLSKYD